MFAYQRANVNGEIISLCYTRYEPIILQLPIQYPVNELSYYCVAPVQIRVYLRAALPVFVVLFDRGVCASCVVVCALPTVLRCIVIITNTASQHIYRKSSRKYIS